MFLFVCNAYFVWCHVGHRSVSLHCFELVETPIQFFESLNCRPHVGLIWKKVIWLIIDTNNNQVNDIIRFLLLGKPIFFITLIEIKNVDSLSGFWLTYLTKLKRSHWVSKTCQVMLSHEKFLPDKGCLWLDDPATSFEGVARGSCRLLYKSIIKGYLQSKNIASTFSFVSRLIIICKDLKLSPTFKTKNNDKTMRNDFLLVIIFKFCKEKYLKVYK